MTQKSITTWAHASRVQPDEVTYDLERTVVGSVVAGATADRCGQCGACDRSVVPVAVGDGEVSDMEVKSALERAAFWLAEAENIGLDVNYDPDGYLAVIRDLVDLVRRRENDLMAAHNGLAQMMLRQSFATGHGGTIADLIGELEWQIKENRERNHKDTRLAYRLLQRVLSCGLNEEPHGRGFTPSRQERLSGDLARDIMDFVSKNAALVCAGDRA